MKYSDDYIIIQFNYRHSNSIECMYKYATGLWMIPITPKMTFSFFQTKYLLIMLFNYAFLWYHRKALWKSFPMILRFMGFLPFPEKLSSVEVAHWIKNAGSDCRPFFGEFWYGRTFCQKERLHGLYCRNQSEFQRIHQRGISSSVTV